MTLDVDWFKRYVAKKREVDELDAKLEAAKAELENMVPIGIDKLIAAGVASVPLVIVRTEGEGDAAIEITEQVLVAPSRTLNLSRKPGVEAAAANKALRAANLDWMLHETYNASTLSSWAREQLDQNNALPKEMLEAFQTIERPALRVTKASKRDSKSARAARNLRAMNQGDDEHGIEHAYPLK